ncbi:MAG: dihydrofolate reductase family protein [Verrucomicrobiota bacterium]
MNLAVSADGKTSDVAGRPSGWTSGADHDRLLELRATAGALLVGRRTLVTDHMTLTCPGREIQPLRCVVAGCGEVPEAHPLFDRAGGAIHWLFTGQPPSLALRFPAEVTVHRGTLADFLTTIKTQLGVDHVHCEGGGTLIRMLAEMDAIDELHLTLAGHTLFGGQEAPTPTGSPSDYLPKSLEFRVSRFEVSPETGECFMSYRRHAQ